MMWLPIIGSLVIGLIAGFLGQRSRMCFVGGLRDFILIRDKELLKGIISFIIFTWISIKILNLIGESFSPMTNSLIIEDINYPSIVVSVRSKFGLLSLLGGLGLGFFSVLAGGCPLRQHVMAGQGRKDSLVYLAGFYIGIPIYYLLIINVLSGSV